MRKLTITATLAATLIALTPITALSKSLKWTSQADIMTLDPHAQNEGLTNTATQFVYEPLIRYNQDYQFIPWLAVSWEQTDPETVLFKLRPGDKFHDGSPFTAEDVKFTLERAAAPTSRFGAYVDEIKEINIIDPLTIEIVTDGPSPALLRQLTLVYMMSKSWAEKHGALQPQNYREMEETFASRNTNGTGPFMLKERVLDVRTVYVENPNWWNKDNKVGNVTEITYVPISQNATRTAALLSGEVDFVLDLPAQDLARLERQVKVVHGNENRTIFFGMDQQSPELKYSNVKGTNPFKDKRVRQALYQALDIEAIKKVVMRDRSIPTGSLIAPQVNGYTEENAKRLPYDPEKARELLRDAGYPDRFSITLDCPNNRYINDEAICQAVAAMWTKIGIKTTLVTMPRATYFAKLDKGDTSIYMHGWGGVPTFDALFNLQSIVHSKGKGADGLFNYGNYHHPEVDALIDHIKVEPDHDKRNELIARAYRLVNEDVGFIPLHVQVIPWAMKKTSISHTALKIV